MTPADAKTHSAPAQSSPKYPEVWNDLVSPRDLVWSLLLCSGATIAALLIATWLGSSLFFWGLGGSVVGFIAAAALIRPKRVVTITDAAVSTVINDDGGSADDDAEGGR